MSSTPNITPAEALASLRAEIRQRTQLVRLITSLQEEIAYDRICGSWLSTENNLSASIRRICTRTYRMLIFDNTLCYRRLVQDTVITAERRTLLFGSRDNPRDMHPSNSTPRATRCSWAATDALSRRSGPAGVRNRRAFPKSVSRIMNPRHEVA